MDYREAAEFLKSRENFLILTHKRPDGDTIGCGVGLCELLRCLGKTAWLLPSLDATSLFTDYLTGHVAPAGYLPDTVVSVDVAAQDLLPDNAKPWLDKIELAIDHHPSHKPFARSVCLEPDKAACGEILWKICDYLGVMNPAIAAPLYVAVSTDTGCFVYANTTPHTHRVAAALMERGIDFQALNKKHFRTKTRRRLAVESLILRDMRLYRGGTVALAPITLALMDEAGATDDDMEDIAAFLGQIQGVLHSVTIREKRNGECKISVRTNARYLDANKVCARLGGGGHAAASGCVFLGTMEDAERAILSAVDEELEQRSPRGRSFPERKEPKEP